MLDPTIVFEARNVTTDPDGERGDEVLVASRVGVGASSSSDASLRLEEATRRILRPRLAIASAVLLSVMAVFTTVALVIRVAEPYLLMLRAVAALCLLAVLWVTRKKDNLSLPQLRWLELVVILVPIVEMQAILAFETEGLLAKGDFQGVWTLRAIIGSAVGMVIAVYGMFIPNDWRRTAAVTFVAACVPTVVAYVHALARPALRGSIDDDIGASVIIPLVPLSMSAIATVGAHIVHAIRRQMETARQFGQYRLTEEIGRGAMGVVYRAEHRMLKRPAAIKLIQPQSAADPSAIERFEREVQISANLSHWNTVQIYDYGRTESGDFYYVMEYLKGRSLKNQLEYDGTLSAARALAILEQLCCGLSEAHAMGMVHRDLKPANIFLAKVGGQTGVVKILDFGLAIANTGVPASEHGPVCGTPNYMSPEQISGKPVDARSDIYALGCVLFECLRGRPPFAGQSISEVFSRHLDVAPALNELPLSAAPLLPVLERCLSKDRESRYESAQALADACGQIARAAEGTEPPTI